MGEGGVPDFGAFERDLRKLPGVTHARVVVEKGRITEVHVISDGQKNVRQLSRDIETVAKAAYDIDLDHRVISISTLVDVDVRPREHRFELVSVAVSTSGGIATSNVVARRADDTGEGTATGAATSSGIPKLVAAAALDAVSTCLGYSLPAEIGNAFYVPVNDLRIATVYLMFVEEDGRETGVGGTAPVRGDQNEALARAVLDAVNRHFIM